MLGNCELRAGALGSPASQDINNSRLSLSSHKSNVCLNPPGPCCSNVPAFRVSPVALLAGAGAVIAAAILLNSCTLL